MKPTWLIVCAKKFGLKNLMTHLKLPQLQIVMATATNGGLL
jgi:hypothetical protein